MESVIKSAKIVDKEEVLNMKFPDIEVLTDPALISNRKTELERATTLGNTEHTKYKIVFADEAGVKQVETTIWGLTDKRVILKKGALIPINRIFEIR